MKSRLGGMAIIAGIVGTGFAVGGVDTAETLAQWVTVIGTAMASLTLMQMGIWMVKDEV